jgi:hypothetical protein
VARTQSIVTRLGNFYWLLAGLVLGFGLLAIFSIGIPIFLFGIIMVLYRVWRAGGRGFWLVIVCMGLVPALYLSYMYFTADRSQVFYDEGGFFSGVLVYVALALAGFVWGLLEARRSKPRARQE